MFEETRNVLRQSRELFCSKIQDSFGRSIDDKVFEPIDGELARMEMAYTEAELKMQEINGITIELRMIV